MAKLRMVDLFAGAGGMSLGFTRAGFQVIHSVDHWRPAVETYRANLGDHIESKAIDIDTRLPSCDLMVGGPPCQGFSSAGARKTGDDRNTLVSVFAKLIAFHRPDAFVFENVEGFITNANGKSVFELLDPLIAAGYNVHIRKVNAANFGVPQHRKRVIAIGGLGWEPPFPQSTHSAWGAPGAMARHQLPMAPTLLEAVAGLPAAQPGECVVGLDHCYPPLREMDLERAKLLLPGQSMLDLPEHLWHQSFRRRAFRRVKDGMPTEKRGGAPCGVRRLHGDAPCKAITGGAQNEFLHPTADRPLTLRECARIQTFPDDFEFHGSRADRLQLIGNAVPPLLAFVIGTELLSAMQSPITRLLGRGKLLSFMPTQSTGMSPILQRVDEAVRRKYQTRNGGLFDAALSA